MTLTQNENMSELPEKVSYLDNVEPLRVVRTAWAHRWVVLFSAIAPAAVIIILSILAPAKYESVAIISTAGNTTRFIDLNKQGLPFWQTEDPVLEVAEQNSVNLKREIPEVEVSFRSLPPALGEVTIRIISTRPQTAKHLAKPLAAYFVKRVKELDPARVEHTLLRKNEAETSSYLRDKLKLFATQSAKIEKRMTVLRNSISALTLAEREPLLGAALNGQLDGASHALINMSGVISDNQRTLENIKFEQLRRARGLGTIKTVSISEPQEIISSVLFSAILSALMALSIVSVALDIRRFLKENDAVTLW